MLSSSLFVSLSLYLYLYLYLYLSIYLSICLSLILFYRLFQTWYAKFCVKDSGWIGRSDFEPQTIPMPRACGLGDHLPSL